MNLIKFKDNWADEMDLDGFRVCSDEETNKIKDAMDKLEFPLEIYFGTNEAVDYHSKESLMNSFTITRIEHSTASLLISYLGKEYGDFPDIEAYVEDQQSE